MIETAFILDMVCIDLTAFIWIYRFNHFYEYISLTMTHQLNLQIVSVNLLEIVLGKGKVWKSEAERL